MKSSGTGQDLGVSLLKQKQATISRLKIKIYVGYLYNQLTLQ